MQSFSSLWVAYLENIGFENTASPTLLSVSLTWFLFFFFPLIKNIYLFLQFGLCWISVAVWAFLYLQQVWAALHCGAEASHCCGFSHCAVPSLGHTGFIFEAHGLSSCRCQALEHWLNSGDTAAQLLHDMWDLPRSGTEPVFSSLAGRFFTTEPPRKPYVVLVLCLQLQIFSGRFHKCFNFDFCDFGVLGTEGEFRVLLLHHLGHSSKRFIKC